jgi:hypothetical protein
MLEEDTVAVMLMRKLVLSNLASIHKIDQNLLHVVGSWVHLGLKVHREAIISQ